jgi:hypothetical protein
MPAGLDGEVSKQALRLFRQALKLALTHQLEPAQQLEYDWLVTIATLLSILSRHSDDPTLAARQRKNWRDEASTHIMQ